MKSYTGWSFGGGFAFVHISHSHLGEGSATGAVTRDTTSGKITYSN